MIRVVLIVFCAGAGLLTGWLARGARTASSPDASPTLSSPKPEPPAGEFDALLQRAQAQERRIAELQARPDAKPKPVDKKAVAKRLLDLLERFEDLNDAEKKEWIRIRDTIDREMAGVFVEGYRAKIKAGATIITELPIHYVWQAGGPEVADFLIERAGDPKAVSHERNVILTMLTGTRLAYHEMESFTVTPTAAAQGRVWVKSQDSLERAAGAGIFGGMDAMESRPILDGLLADPDFLVRGAAVKALGRIGDDATLDRLMELRKSTETGPNWSEYNKALTEAIQRLMMEKSRRERP